MKKESGNSFIDENHSELLEHLATLSNLSSDNWNPANFKVKLDKFISDIENHLSHEEIILQGAKYDELSKHKLVHRQIALKLHESNIEEVDYKKAVQTLNYIRHELISHEMMDDQKYWPLFEKRSSKLDLIKWTPDIETGHPEIDAHHFSLVNHINRFYINIIEHGDILLACRELKVLCAYSEYHFQEEEKLLSADLKRGHILNHQKLLDDMEVLIIEIKSGKFKLLNLGDYLEFWLLNHIRMYDIPAVKDSHG